MPKQNDPSNNDERSVPPEVTAWTPVGFHDLAAQHIGEANVPAIWQVGDVILEQYEVMGILGEGGMGTVYQVHHRGWNTDLAVKSPKPAIFAKPEGKENFIREAQTWVNLGLHPHIVSCYYVRILGGIPRVFAEYVEGGSLADWIRTRKLYEGGHQKALERMLDIAIQFAWGLHYAHEQRLIHQDVKPANVMMTTDSIVKVTDFGLAQVRGLAGEVIAQEEAGMSMVVPGVGLMTPAYASPEQMQRKPLTRKTDIWSWGVSVLEMFVGARTWLAGAIAADVLASHEAEDPTIPVMPAEVVKLLARCFRPRAEDRPATMLEAASELKTLYAHLAGHPYPHQEPKPAEALADSLNNRALSLFDLGKLEEAKQVWEQAFTVDPQHLEATYNRGVILWRRGELTDNVLVHQIEIARDVHGQQWQASYLLAQIHLERRDVDNALPLLQDAVQQAPGETEVQALLKRTQTGNTAIGRSLHTLQGHMKRVKSVSLSTDGQQALSGSVDQTMRLWDVATGRCLLVFQGHTKAISSVSLSADGHLALSGSVDQTMRLWDVAARCCVQVFRGHTNSVNSVSLSTDGHLALSGSGGYGVIDNTVRLWEVGTGHCLHILQGHTADVNSVSLSTDGHLALSGSDDHTVRLWDVSTGQCLLVFQGHSERVNSVSLSADGRWALSGSDDQTMRLWDVSTGQCLRILQGHTETVWSVSLSADGRWGLSGSKDQTMRLWDVNTGQCLRTFQAHLENVGSVNQDKTSQRVDEIIMQYHKKAVWSVSLSADGCLALSGTEDKAIRLWEIDHQRSLCSLRLSQSRSHAEIAQIETRAEMLLKQVEHARSETHFVEALDRLREVRALPGWERIPKSMEEWARLSLCCSRVAFRAGWPIMVFRGHTNQIHSVSLGADGHWALSGCKDNTVRLWEVRTGRCLHILQGHKADVKSVCLSTDGRLALSGSDDKTVRVWEMATGHCLRIFEGHTGAVSAVSLSADGRWALSADWNVWLWEVSTGHCQRVFKRHMKRVNSVFLSADGCWALSGSDDKTVQLWMASTGHRLRVFKGHLGAVYAVNLSVDGCWVLSGSETRPCGCGR